jgi:soluble lytic murein transglycosylase-like protein
MTKVFKIILIPFLFILAGAIAYAPRTRRPEMVVIQQPSRQTVDIEKEKKIQAAMWSVALVFGRSSGCKDAGPELGRIVAEAAIDQGVDPSVDAATVAVESSCNPFATSTRGAAGLMQLMPSIWKTTYDFQNKINLFNERDNVQTGTKILAGYIKTYGTQDGILHYQGTGSGCSTCDSLYVDKVLRLAEGR